MSFLTQFCRDREGLLTFLKVANKRGNTATCVLGRCETHFVHAPSSSLPWQRTTNETVWKWVRARVTCVKAHVKRRRERGKRDLCLKIADGGGGGAKDTSSSVAVWLCRAWVNERVKRDGAVIHREGDPEREGGEHFRATIQWHFYHAVIPFEQGGKTT